MKKQSNINRGLFLFLIAIVVGSFFFFFSDILMENERYLEDKLYPELKEIEYPVIGVILSIKRSSAWNGSLLVKLKNGKSFSISERAYNYNKIYNLADFLEVNDSINKSICGDTIYLYRENKEYTFTYKK